jgi:hypothetical protein
LDGEPLLDLETSGEVCHHSRELGQTEQTFHRQVTDVSHPREGKEMMLTKRGERYRPRHHEFVVTLIAGKVVASNGSGVSTSA